MSTESLKPKQVAPPSPGKVKKTPKPPKSETKEVVYHIFNETIPTHMAINGSKFSPLMCGSFKKDLDTTFKHATVVPYRLIRDQNAPSNRFATVQQIDGWEYGIPMVVLHPKQFDGLHQVCYEIAKELNILLVNLHDAETIFNMDVSKAWTHFEETMKGEAPSD